MTRFAHTYFGIAVAAAVLVAGCSSSRTGGTTDTNTTATRSTAAAPPTFHGEQARAARAVDELARALRDGDVERLCRPAAVFTPAVVAGMNTAFDTCEQDVELSSIFTRPPALSVVKLSHRPDLATLQVRVGRGATIPLDVVRGRRRWLVSFSDGNDPLTALAAA